MSPNQANWPVVDYESDNDEDRLAEDVVFVDELCEFDPWRAVGT